MEFNNNYLERKCHNADNTDNNDYKNNIQKNNISDNNMYNSIFEVDKVYLFKKIRVLMNSHEMPYLLYSNLSSHFDVKNKLVNRNENFGNFGKSINDIISLY